MLGLNSRTDFNFLTRYNRLADIRERPVTPKGGSPLHAPSGLRVASTSVTRRADHEGDLPIARLDAISRETVYPKGAFLCKRQRSEDIRTNPRRNVDDLKSIEGNKTRRHSSSLGRDGASLRQQCELFKKK